MMPSATMKKNMILLFLIVLLATPHDSFAQECLPCANGEEPFVQVDRTYNCTDAIERAKSAVNGTDECSAIQLGTYQGGCCDTAPPNFCNLCDAGNATYNAEKIIPSDRLNYQQYTCENVATRDQYVRVIDSQGGDEYETCSDTPRGKSAAWCECSGVVNPCQLVCDDGNPPPDMAKKDQVFQTTCERFSYDYTGLESDKCNDQAAATKRLNFDAKAFCCNEPPPENCQICPAGYYVPEEDMDKVLQSEFFGEVTCGEIVEHAKYLPGGQCKRMVNELLDVQERGHEDCCVKSDGSATTPYGGGGMILMLLSATVAMLALLC